MLKGKEDEDGRLGVASLRKSGTAATSK